MQCPGCATEIAPQLLVCPFCQTLTRQAELNELAAASKRLQAAGDVKAALARWREVHALLPPGSKQSSQVSVQIAELVSQQVAGSGSAGIPWKRYGLLLGTLALLLWKFKFVAVFVATKGKLLLLGLTKSSTVFSMLLSLGVYWTVFGWKFALGLVLSIYVHEMGHVFALNRLGIKASAPMFIPGLGAMVRMEQYPASPSEDAQVGLAGPLWGLIAVIFCWAVFMAGGGDIWGAIARVGAWINLLNLIPFWQLDGHRGFRALSRYMRAVMLLWVAAVAWFSGQGIVWLIVIAGLFTLRGEAPLRSDRSIVALYALLIVVLSYLSGLQVL